MSKWFGSLCHIKPTLKAPVIKLVRQKYDKEFNFASNFNLRRYAKLNELGVFDAAVNEVRARAMYRVEAGAYTPPLLSST